MKSKEIRELSVEDCGKKSRELRSELVNLRVRKQVGQVEKPTELQRLRKDIARFETIIREKNNETAAAAK